MNVYPAMRPVDHDVPSALNLSQADKDTLSHYDI